MSPPLNPGKDGGGAGAHLREAERGRGKMGGGGGVDVARGRGVGGELGGYGEPHDLRALGTR